MRAGDVSTGGRARGAKGVVKTVRCLITTHVSQSLIPLHFAASEKHLFRETWATCNVKGGVSTVRLKLRPGGWDCRGKQGRVRQP